MPRRIFSGRRLILLFFCGANALISFNISALIAIIPQMGRALNVPANEMANIIAFYMIPYGLCALIYVPMATRISVKTLMIASTLVYTVSNVICLSSNSLAVILAGRFVSGVAAAAVLPLSLITLGKVFEKHVRGRVIGILFASSFFGSIFGLLVSEFASWRFQFIVPAVFGVIWSGAYIFCPNEGMEAHRGTRVNYGEAFVSGGLRRILALIFLMSLLFHGVCKWYGVYLDKIYGYDQKTISAIIIISSVAAMLGQTIGGYVTDKAGRKISCYTGIIILSFSIMALYGHYPMWLLTLVLSLVSVGWTVAHNGISTVLTDFPDRYRCELAGLNSAVRFVSGGIGFWLSGNFVQSYFGKTFFIIGILMLFMIGFVIKIVPQQANQKG